MVIEYGAITRPMHRYHFAEVDLAASLTAAVVPILEVADVAAVAEDSLAVNEYVMPWPGWIVAIAVSLSAARTAGTATLEPTVNGTVKTPTAVADATNTQYPYKKANIENAARFAAGDRLGCKATTTAAWAPTTADLLVDIYVIFDEVHLEFASKSA